MGQHPSLNIRAGLLPGDFAATFQTEGAKIGILGLNSAFLQLAGGDYKQRLALDYRQFDGACGRSGPEWAHDHHLCFLLTHHPRDWLCPEAQDELGRMIDGKFAIHLYGHMHQTAYRALSVGGRAAERSWQGLSLFGEETSAEGTIARRYGYAIGKVTLRGTEGELRLWPRKATHPQGGRWNFVADPDDCQLDERNNNATQPETLKLHRDVVEKVAVVAASSSPMLTTASVASAPGGAHDSRRFRVLVLATDADLAQACVDVSSYLEQALGVEVAAGAVDPAIDPASFDHVVLLQGHRWEGGNAASLWERAPADRRVALVSDPTGNWPPYRLIELPALEQIDKFRDSLHAAKTFTDPTALPEKVGTLVSESIAKHGIGHELGVKPWERAYLGYSVDVWRSGRTAASRSYLLDSAAREEPYSPELYIALDGMVEGWLRDENGMPRRSADDIRSRGEYERRVSLARWVSCPDFPRLALVGAPGAGKTVFLTRIAASLGTACLGRVGDLERNFNPDALRVRAGRLPIPIIVEATRLAKQDLARGLDALLTAIDEELAKGGQSRPGVAAVREGLEQGRYLLLVDALDEIADAEQRRRVLDLLRAVGQPECFPGTRLVLTTRSAAYTGNLRFSDFGVVQVAPLSQDQIQSFCARWSRHRRRDDAFTGGLQTAVADLSEVDFDQDPTLTSNPLMLTAICLVYEKHRALPDDRGRLCQLLVDDLCRSRPSEDPEHDWQLDDAGKKRLLQRIALAMQEEGAQSWPEARALTEVRDTLPIGETQPDLRAHRYLQWIAEHTGLIRFELSGDEERIRFWHRLFREYLAASEIAQRDRQVRDLVDELWKRNRLTDPFWEDVVRLLPRALNTPHKAQVLGSRLEELAQEHVEARGRLLGLAAAGMIESRELFTSVDFGVKAEQLATTYERDSTAWLLRDRRLVLMALSRLDLRLGDPRLREERWVNFSGGDVVLGDEVGDLITKKCDVPPRKVTVAPFAMAWAPVSYKDYIGFAKSSDFSNPRFWTHAPRKLRGKQSTTSEQFLLFLEVRGHTRPWNGPMIGVSLYEALAYCAWRTERRTDGRIVRLPTESEWEYVARGDGGSPYPWGAELPHAEEESGGWSAALNKGIFPFMGMFPPIAGVVDIVGQVAQWCDSSIEHPYGEPATSRAQQYGGVIAPNWNLVLRGGQPSDNDGEESALPLRCAYRVRTSGNTSIWGVGVRLVLDPPL